MHLTLTDVRLNLKKAMDNGWIPKMTCKVWEDSAKKVRITNCPELVNDSFNLIVKTDLYEAVLKRTKHITQAHTFYPPEFKDKVFNFRGDTDMLKEIDDFSHRQNKDYMLERHKMWREVDDSHINFHQLKEHIISFYEAHSNTTNNSNKP